MQSLLSCLLATLEEAISIRYMLRCMGVPVLRSMDLYGDNFGVIQSAESPKGKLKKNFRYFLPPC